VAADTAAVSGIAGIIGRGSINEVRRMGEAMAYRGPRRRVWSPGRGVFFVEAGHDLGEPYNGPVALTNVVRDAGGSSLDCMPLVDRLRTDPCAALNSLRGNFALAAYDSRAGGSVTLAVDSLEYRTLYIVRLHGRLAFASDYKALLALDDCPAAADRNALQQYLGSMARDLTQPMLAGCVRLARGQMARIAGDSLDIKSYLRLPTQRIRSTPRQSAELLREALELAVERCVRGQTHVAVTLSGGLDATCLVALIRHLRPEVEISTYTIGFGPDDPEIVGARQSATHFRTNHHEVFFDNAELEFLLPRYVFLTEDLAGSGEAILQQKITESIAPGPGVLLAGHGADVTFTGMPRHRLLWLAELVPPPLRGGLLELLIYSQMRVVPPSWLGRRLVQFAYGESPRPPLQVRGAAPVSMSEEQLRLSDYMRASCNVMNNFQYHEPVDDAAGLECATPFIEVEVRDLAQRTPVSHMITARFQKKILRDAMADLLPDSFRNRPKAIQRLKLEQSLPATLFSLAEKFDMRHRLKARGLFDPQDIDRILGRRLECYSLTRLSDLWTLVCAEIWMQTFVDARGRSPLQGAFAQDQFASAASDKGLSCNWLLPKPTVATGR